jgi:hypothetical protein
VGVEKGKWSFFLSGFPVAAFFGKGMLLTISVRQAYPHQW